MHTAIHPDHLLAAVTAEGVSRHVGAADRRAARRLRAEARRTVVARRLRELAGLLDVQGSLRPTPLLGA